jgi:hypothetical protein
VGVCVGVCVGGCMCGFYSNVWVCVCVGSIVLCGGVYVCVV